MDNAKVGFGGEVNYRAELEAKISEHFNKEDKIPLVVLVLGGGFNTVDSIRKAVEKGTPVVIFNVKKYFCLSFK